MNKYSGFRKTNGISTHLEHTKPPMHGTEWSLGNITHGDRVRGKMRAEEDAELGVRLRQ